MTTCTGRFARGREQVAESPGIAVPVEFSEVCPAIFAAGAAGSFKVLDATVALEDDLKSLLGVRCVPPPTHAEQSLTLPLPSLQLNDSNERADWLALPGGGFVVPAPVDRRTPPALGPILRCLVDGPVDRTAEGAFGDTELPGGWRLTGGSDPLHRHARSLAEESAIWEVFADRDFANSAPYMGTKRALLPFLMTAFEALTPPTDAFVDLMCGSGIVSGAAARRWRTISSDSQAFCRSLAVVQGGGFSRVRASDTLARLREPMVANLNQLTDLLGELLEEEARFLTAAADWPALASLYAAFVERTPSYPDGGVSGLWDPVAEVDARRSGAADRPYCLMSAYFANLYFGVRQAIELDSLRYAVDQLDDEVARAWALGALVVTASSVATTYGGHFAQPPAPPDRLMNPGTARRVLSRRHMSATREFEIRLLSLSSESEGVAHPVEVLPGPWPLALDQVSKLVEPTRALVYVDAPYRREEYSRYYHVLETLVTYGYPSAETAARVPAKGSERFASEFFTRSEYGMTDALSSVLRAVLRRGFSCAWSYADRADANPLDVLEAVSNVCRRVRSVTADHNFKRQGRSRESGRVREFLFLLEPQCS
jgi:adenine-specific DNA-methyltransferase